MPLSEPHQPTLLKLLKCILYDFQKSFSIKLYIFYAQDFPLLNLDYIYTHKKQFQHLQQNF